METKHTKGEWIITPMKCWKGEPILITHESKTGFVIAEITNQGISRFISNKEEAEANAKLIAAAPQMLEALEYVIRWHREHDSGEGELFGLDFVTTCIAAKRKATE